MKKECLNYIIIIIVVRNRRQVSLNCYIYRFHLKKSLETKYSRKKLKGRSTFNLIIFVMKTSEINLSYDLVNPRKC